MRSFICSAFLLLALASTPIKVSAWPGGAGQCLVGMSSVDQLHLTAADRMTGTLEAGNYAITVNGETKKNGETATVTAETAFEIRIQTTSTNNFRGVLIMVAGQDSSVITPGTNVGYAVFGNCNQTASVTHMDRTDKTSATATVLIDQALATTLELNVVEINIPDNNGFSRYYYSQVNLVVQSKKESKGKGRRRMLSEGAVTPMYQGEETYKNYLSACGEQDYDVALYVDADTHFYLFGSPKAEDAAGCPVWAAHSVMGHDESEEDAQEPFKEILLWTSMEEAEYYFAKDARLHMGTYQLAQMARAFEKAEPTTKGNVVYDIVANNCAAFLVNLANEMDIKVDYGRVTSYVTRRLLENSGAGELVASIRNSLNYLSLFGNKGAGRSLHAETATDQEIVELLVEKGASPLL